MDTTDAPVRPACTPTEAAFADLLEAERAHVTWRSTTFGNMNRWLANRDKGFIVVNTQGYSFGEFSAFRANSHLKLHSIIRLLHGSIVQENGVFIRLAATDGTTFTFLSDDEALRATRLATVLEADW